MNAAEAKKQTIANHSKRIEQELKMVKEKIQEQVNHGYFDVVIENAFGKIRPEVWQNLKDDGYSFANWGKDDPLLRIEISW